MAAQQGVRILRLFAGWKYSAVFAIAITGTVAAQDGREAESRPPPEVARRNMATWGESFLDMR